MVSAPKKITVLGSTGSVGVNTLDLIRRNPETFEVVALTAGANATELVKQAQEFKPACVVIADESHYQSVADALVGTGIEVSAGATGLVEAAQRPTDITMAAIVGAAGLPPTLAAIPNCKTLALANKESLVCAGEIVMDKVRQHDVTLLPVDSEHSAIFQVFDFDLIESVSRIILTASGGPFREWSLEQMAAATPAQATNHPNWSMGSKISVDSASMMNKGLELIEADHLFPVGGDKIEILVHPQSVIHSLVDYVDGSVLAQLGTPDMRTPIAYALAWPERMTAPSPRLNLAEISQLTFEAPDSKRFPALRLAREALQSGGAAPTILNAANEVAVAKFLAGNIGFLDIVATVEETLAKSAMDRPGSLEDIFALDLEARRIAESWVPKTSVLN